METDAALLLVLSTYVARDLGLWVLAIGLARYVFLAAKVPLPWLRGQAPPRPWCKVVAALQGIVLRGRRVAACSPTPSPSPPCSSPWPCWSSPSPTRPGTSGASGSRTNRSPGSPA